MDRMAMHMANMPLNTRDAVLSVYLVTITVGDVNLRLRV